MKIVFGVFAAICMCGMIAEKEQFKVKYFSVGFFLNITGMIILTILK